MIDKNSISMKSILLKLDDKLFEETEKQVKELKMSRNGYIKMALESYNRSWAKKALEEQIKREVEIIKNDKQGWAEFKEWEEASLVDLNNYLDKLENGRT